MTVARQLRTADFAHNSVQRQNLYSVAASDKYVKKNYDYFWNMSHFVNTRRQLQNRKHVYSTED